MKLAGKRGLPCTYGRRRRPELGRKLDRAASGYALVDRARRSRIASAWHAATSAEDSVSLDALCVCALGRRPAAIRYEILRANVVSGFCLPNYSWHGLGCEHQLESEG